MTTAALAILVGALSFSLGQRVSAEPRSPRPVAPEYLPGWRQLLPADTATDQRGSQITLIAFVDLQCQGCREFHRTVRGLRSKFGSTLTVMYRHLPLPYHRYAHGAARATECARVASRTDQFLDAIYAKQESLGVKSWESYGVDAGITDTSSFRRCTADSIAASWRVEADVATARHFAFNSTPTVVVDGWRFRGVPDEAALADLISGIRSGRIARPSDSPQSDNAILPRLRSEGGTAILEHDAGALGRAAKLLVEAQAEASFGGADEDPDFDISDATSYSLLPDGRVATFSPLGSKLLLFTNGKPPRRVGSRGAGPNEFLGIPNMVVGAGDTLVLPDLANMRLYRVTPDAGIVRSESLRGRLSPRATRIAGALSRGRVVFTSGRTDAGRGQLGKPTRPLAAIVVMSPGENAQVIAHIPAGELVPVMTRYEGRSRVYPTALGFGRTVHVTVLNDEIVMGSGDGYRLEVRSSSGQVVRVLTVAAPRRPVTNAMRRALIARQLQQLATAREKPIDPSESQRLIREGPFADSLPPYSALHSTPRRRLWVVDAVAPGDTRWTATQFRSDGAILGRVSGDVGALPVAFGDERVLLRAVDQLGVVTLSVHRIVLDRR